MSLTSVDRQVTIAPSRVFQAALKLQESLVKELSYCI